MSNRLLSTMMLHVQFQSLVSFGGCRQKRLSRGYSTKSYNTKSNSTTVMSGC